MIQASQRSGGTEPGGVGGFTMIPSSPLNTLENFAGRSCTASASASVTAARYGPVSRVAGTPTRAPRAAATATATRSGTTSGRSKCSIINPAAYGADGHEGAVPERDLTADAGQHRQPRDGDGVPADLGELGVVVVADGEREPVEQGAAHDSEREVPEGAAVPTAASAVAYGTSSAGANAGTLTPASPSVARRCPRAGSTARR